MLDKFDRALLNEVQRNDGRTAEQLAEVVPLSPSAIARRLRRLRATGAIERTIALVGAEATGERLRAIVQLQLAEHADQAGKAALRGRLMAESQVQLAYEITGAWDMVVMLDCTGMAAFEALAERLFAADPTVRRYEASFVRRSIKFAPFVRLTD
jgi:Lrp/AsnC family leucine-responsive transcriptional regulator